MATTSTMIGTVPPGPGLGLVLVEFDYEYKGRDGVFVRIKPNERYELLSKTTSHWWQVRTGPGARPFYIPAKYVRELPEVPPLLFYDPIGPETIPAASPAPLPVHIPVPKTLEETRSKSSDEVTIRLRAEGGYRKQENRMSTFGVPADFQDVVPNRGLALRTTNGSGTTNMGDGLRPQAQGDSKKNRVTGFTDQAPVPRLQPIPVETPRAPPTHDVTQEGATKKVKEEMKVETTAKKGQQEVVTVKEQQEVVTVKEQQEVVTVKEQQEVVTVKEQQEVVTVKEQQEAVTVKGQQKAMTVKGQHEVVTVKGQKEAVTIQGEMEEEEEVLEEEPSEGEEEKEESSSHIYESIQDLNIDLDALIGRDSSHKQEVDDETPAPPQEALCLIYANVPVKKHLIIPPPPSDPAPAAPGPAPSFSGFSSSGLSPASPLSPLDEWQTHTDADSGKLFYYHPLTRHSTWTQPPSAGAHLDAGPAPSQPLPEEDYPQDSQDDSVFTSNPQLLIPRAHLDSKYDAFRRISELPAMPQRMMGNGVSEEGAVSTRTWRHSVAEDKFYSSKGHAPDSLQGHPLEKAGILNKTKVCDNGKKVRKNWSQSWTVLHGGILTFHKDPKSAPTGTNSKASQIVPEFTVELKGASLSWACNKSSKKNVLELKTRLGCEYLMQYDTESIINDWFKVISDTIRQLQEWDHLTDDSDDSDKDDKDQKSSSSRSSSGADSEQRRVRTKLRRFLQRRPTLQSVKEKGYIRDNVFGCHLDTLCHRENSTVPRFVEKCIRSVERRGLDSDGIYRVSGNLAVIQRLRHKADHEEQLDLEDGQWTEIHVITGALKLFFRELPEPLFPFSSYDRFIAAIQLSDYSQRVSYVKDLVQTLPLPNHDTMELLFKHLRRVVEHKDSNRMSVHSLAIVFGPTLLRPQVESNMTVHMVFQSQIVELLLNEFSAAFPRNNQK